MKKGKINFSFKGGNKDVSVKVLSNVPSSYTSFSKLESGKDSLLYWHTPVERDSLLFLIGNTSIKDTVMVRLTKKKIDSLQLSSKISSTLHINDTLIFESNNPIAKIDNSKFILKLTDSIPVDYTLKKIGFNRVALNFKQVQKSRYAVNVLPGAIHDIYQTTNDSLRLTFGTKELEDYGVMNFTLKNKLKAALIVQIYQKEKVVRETKLEANTTKVSFKHLLPSKYKVRVLVDENNNARWDTGNYLMNIQPEKVVYFPKELVMKANWEIEETIIIE